MSTPKTEKTEGKKQQKVTAGYRRPKVFRLGKAVKLVQGRPHGTNNDSYSGYYWEG